jgi:Putative Flp pilus-assembly TadE/G-like
MRPVPSLRPPGLRPRTDARPPGHGEKGQILPALLAFALAILAAGVLLFQVGRAADLRGRAQTAADAGAIAAAEDVRQQYARAIHSCNCPNQGAIFSGTATVAAAGYAARNQARLDGFSRTLLTVRVSVATFERLDGQDAAPVVGDATGHASARARVFTDPALWPVVAGFTAAQQQVPVAVVLRFLHVRLVPDRAVPF